MLKITKLSSIIISLFLIIGLTQTIDGLNTGFVNGVYTVFCNQMCFDLIKNQSTKGYDPEFLKIPLVKQTCSDAMEYSKSMGFCDLVK